MRPKTHKSKMGRPPKNPADRLEWRVNLCLTRAEYEMVFADAKRAGMGPGAYLRDLWLKHRRPNP